MGSMVYITRLFLIPGSENRCEKRVDVLSLADELRKRIAKNDRSDLLPGCPDGCRGGDNQTRLCSLQLAVVEREEEVV